MTQTDNKNFDWLKTAPVKTQIAQDLVDCCKKAHLNWTVELDAAARIILFAANGGLANRKYNEMYLTSIKSLLSQEVVQNSEVIDIAMDIIEDSFFYKDADTGIVLESAHYDTVRSFSAQSRMIHNSVGLNM